MVLIIMMMVVLLTWSKDSIVTSLTQYSHGGNCKFIIIHLFKFLTAFDGFAAAGEALDIAKKKRVERHLT